MIIILSNKQQSSHNCEYPLREWTKSEAVHSLAPSRLVVEVKFFSLFEKLMQVQRLHYCHETCRKEQVCVPSVQSQDIASSWWLGDIEKMTRKILEEFSCHFSNVGYA